MKYTCGIILLDQSKKKVLALHPTGAPKNVLSIPKGHMDEAETPFTAALREFEEETGSRLFDVASDIVMVGTFEYSSGKKTLYAFAAIQDKEFSKPINCTSMFERHGKLVAECDWYEWLNLDQIDGRLHETQVRAIQHLMKYKIALI